MFISYYFCFLIEEPNVTEEIISNPGVIVNICLAPFFYFFVDPARRGFIAVPDYCALLPGSVWLSVLWTPLRGGANTSTFY